MRYKIVLMMFLLFIVGTSCRKSDFLNVKPDEKLSIPKTLEEFQSILDFHAIMNGNGSVSPIPSLGHVGADDYYADPDFIQTVDEDTKYYYQWNDNINWNLSRDWTFAYQCIYTANLVLEGIAKINNDNETLFNNIKGSALFYRSHAYYQLAQVFAPVYNPQTAVQDLGLPIRKYSDIGEKMQRVSVEETYKLILSDLEEAKRLLPEFQSIKTRPSKVASDALLARVYLSMSQYVDALKYANNCFPKVQNTLLDYATLDENSLTPFGWLNNEVIFDGAMYGHIWNSFSFSRINTDLYSSYHTNDLRKMCFFGDASLVGGTGYFFKGGYYGQLDLVFGGIAADEIFLIRAECNARLGNHELAMKDLNDLLRTRWRKINGVTTYVDQTANSAEDALKKILIERRKELVYRGLRWTDLRRLNLEGANISITRVIDGQTYTLAPNDKRYTYLIPSNVISFNPDMPQNKR